MANLELSPREREVAKCIAQGIKPTDIARHLGLSVKTVSTYRARIMEKTGATSNVGIAAYCVEHSIIAPLSGPDFRGLLEKAYRAIKAFRGDLEADSEATLKLAAVEYEAMMALYGDPSETAVPSDG